MTKNERRITAMVLAFGAGMSVMAAAPQLTEKPQNIFGGASPTDFDVQFDGPSQTLISLKPKGAQGFDFLPHDQDAVRQGNRYYYLGDLTFQLRQGANGQWRDFSTAHARKPVKVLEPKSNALSIVDLAPTLPDDCPLHIIRTWTVEDGKLVLRFDMKNESSSPLEIGALGIPLIFNNIITDLVHHRPRTLDQAHHVCSFTDPAICDGGGYVQVTRLNGHGPALVVVPEGNTPLEAWNPLSDDRTPISQTFEGFYEWMVHSKAYAENEWKNAQPWNAPTAETLAPGETRTFGLKFLLSPEIRDINKTLTANKRPVAVGVPGYILPMGMDARLFLNYGSKVKSISTDPAGAIAIRKDAPTKAGWDAYTLLGKKWGRSRLTVTYDNGLVQTISYYVTKPEQQTLADLGHFLFTKQWFTDKNDPFHRAPSVITYDRELNKPITQNNHAWIAGLSDEGGSSSWLAAAMKEFVEPSKAQVEKFEQFVDQVLWGHLQYSSGPLKYGVRKSLFYYDPKEFPNYYGKNIHFGGWASWSRQEAEKVDRGYNYPHVVAAYWVMYRLARDHQGLVTNHKWGWYLNQAYQTIHFAFDSGKVGWTDLGLMDGTVFLKVLQDLQREGWDSKAADVKAMMKKRADIWKNKAYPFGSEMAWDSTGQEEVYGWCNYFGYKEKAQVTLGSIVGYMPTVPNWGYNGDARRYWDFDVAGKLRRIERQIHHYGSGLNAIPALTAYRQNPDDYHLLLMGYAGAMAALSNIDPEGFAAQAFHAFPSTMKWDAFSSDYGQNLFGHAVNMGTYIVDHPEFGWIAFGGDLKNKGNMIQVKTLDSLRQRIYIAPFGLYLTLDAGRFEGVKFNPKTHQVRIILAPAGKFTSKALLRIEQPAKIAGIGQFHVSKNLPSDRGAYPILLSKRRTVVELFDIMNK